MNREEKVAYEIIRQRIVNELDRLESLGKDASASTFKKWRRYGAAFAWDPSVYSNILEQPDMSDSELLSALRSKEDAFMRRWGYVKKIPLHHEIANRTGGDLGIRTPVDVWLETKERIFDATGARPGNGQGNLNATGAFDELWHLGRTGAKGSVFEGTGVITPEDFPYLHRAGQNLAEKLGKDPKMVQASAAEQAEALIGSIVQQQQRFQETTATPQVQQQRKIFTDLGYSEIVDPTSTMEEIVDIQKATQNTPIPSIFARAGSITFDPQANMQEYIRSAEGQAWFSKESARRAAQGKPFNPYNLYGGVPFAQEMIETIRTNPLGAGLGALTAVDPEAIKSARQGEYGKAAVQAATGATLGAVIEQGAKKIAPTVMRLIPQAGKMMLAPVVGAVAAPLTAGMAGYQALDVITTAATGKTLAETGQAAEETKEQLRQQGLSEYQLRRKARTGRY
jgi:hypothetical protein